AAALHHNSPETPKLPVSPRAPSSPLSRASPPSPSRRHPAPSSPPHRPFDTPAPSFVTPAKAGAHAAFVDSRFRGNDGRGVTTGVRGQRSLAALPVASRSLALAPRSHRCPRTLLRHLRESGGPCGLCGFPLS